jgi:hypothetical protein
MRRTAGATTGRASLQVLLLALAMGAAAGRGGKALSGQGLDGSEDLDQLRA